MCSSWSGPGRRSRSSTWPPTCCASPPRASPSRPRPWARRSILTRSKRMWSPWGWAPPAPARPIWRWPPPWPPSAPRRSTASSSPARRWRRESGWASCPAISSPRWTPTCGPCTTPCLTCWARRPIRSTWSGGTSRWPPWPICGAAPWTTPLSFWTRPRTPPGSR